MNHPALDWNDLRFFLELAEQRTLSSAARALRVTHVTVARRLASLEHAMKVQLFERSHDGYALTEAGRHLHAEALSVRRAIAGVESVRDSGTNGALRAKVRITSTRTLADLWLAGHLARLRARHPQIAIDLLASDRTLSLANREADLALRLARPDRGELLIRRVSTLGFAFYATPGYLAQTPRDAWRFIGYPPASTVPEAAWLRASRYGSRVVFVSNSLVGQRTAAEHGVGIAVLPCYVGDVAPPLVRVDDGLPTPPERDLWIVMLPSVARTKPVRIAIDYLADAFETDAARFRGAPPAVVAPSGDPRRPAGFLWTV